MNINRRKFLIAGTAASLLTSKTLAADHGNSVPLPTPDEVEGPFYPLVAQKDKDFDLTQIEGHNEKAKGQAVSIIGNVIDTDGSPVEDAIVDLWQANAAGRYRHSYDSNPAPLDEHFQGWAIVQSSQSGGFRFKTIIPGAYPVRNDWTRPPHIHFKITKKGYRELITQMYFPDQELNKIDLLLQRKSPEEQELMIAEKDSELPDAYHYRIVIEKA